MDKMSQEALAVKRAEQAFDRKRRTIGLFGGPILALLVFFTPIAGLTLEAHKLLAIMVLVAIWWITEPVPIPVTSLIGPTLAVVTGVVPAGTAFAAFANPMIFLFMGGFILAKAMMTHGIDKRFAYWLLSRSWVGSNPRRIFLAVGLAAALCSGWVSNTATAAMMFPICLGLLSSIKEMFAANGREIDLHEYKYATGLMLMTAYSCSIGGVLTPIGTPPNLIMLGFLDQMCNIHVSFFQWMTWGFIAMVLYFIIAYIVLIRMFPADVKRIDGAEEFVRSKIEELGEWTRAQKNTVFCFGVAVLLWILPGFLSIALGGTSPVLKMYNRLFPEAVAAMAGALLLFLMPINFERRQFTLAWKDAKEGIEWGTLILFGGGLAMGGMMYKTGLSQWVGDAIIGMMGGNPPAIAMIAIFSVMALLLSELTSHTAATNMIGPLAITAAISAGMDPIPVSVAIALSASLGFMLPVSTPPNAIVYASGYIPITKMIRTGVYIDFIGIACVTIPLAIYFVSWIVH
ncbi:SLC13 family permease [Mitsuokella sp.]|uniref:SLC13 family permease n=1 Tax=Mitsuokella TaxID=52225 RepID=UPI0029DF8158|nr:DASS family sodium-coupled anion symporter [Mitsuokella sp.]MDD6382037.1 DASS family sodium-coupled anion symporter [Selenomonadaceae bacterium]MDY4474895.1 DASS family sodium-coupled anion symporter [Mitsuokella sp.]